MLSKQYGEYVGMDVHKRIIHATVLNGIGEKMLEKRFQNNIQELEEFTGEISSKAKIAMESSSVWQKVYDFLEEKGFDVQLAHPLKTRAIAEARIKTDSRDSEILAELRRGNLIVESYVPVREIRMLREFVRHRAMLSRMRTEIKNRVHSILTKNGIVPEFSDLFGKEGMEFLKKVEVDNISRLALDNFISLVEHINKELSDIDTELFEVVDKNEDAQLLTSVPGLGPYAALLVVSEIGDINRFPSAKRLCSYAGLVPRVYQSGNKIRRGKITKQGNKWLRWIIIQATHHAVKKEGKLQGFFWKLERRKGKKTAITACARKLLITIYYMLKEKKEYQEVLSHQFHAQAKGDSGVFSGNR